MYNGNIEETPKDAMRDCITRLAAITTGQAVDGGLAGLLADMKDVYRAMPKDKTAHSEDLRAH